MSAKLEHANLVVQNLDEMLRFIQTAFPEFAIRERGKKNGARWAHVGSNDTYLAMTEAFEPNASSRQPYDQSPGLNHLGYQVDDVEGVRKRLAEAGYRDSTYPNAHPHRKRVYFLDNEGNDRGVRSKYLSDDPSERHDYQLPD